MSEHSKSLAPLTLRQILPRHYDLIGCVVWSPDGTLLVSDSEDSTIRLWDFSKGEILRAFKPEQFMTDRLLWSPDNRFLISTARFEDSKIWDIKQNRLHAVIKNAHWISLAYSPDGKLVACYEQSEIKILDFQTLNLVKTIPLDKKQPVKHNPIEWSNNGGYLAIVNEEKLVHIYDTKDWSLYKIINIPNKSSDYRDMLDQSRILWMPDNNTLLVSSTMRTDRKYAVIEVWDIQASRLVTQLKSPRSEIVSLSLSPNKTILAAKSSKDSSVELWRCSDWTSIAIVPVISEGYAMDFHPFLPILALTYNPPLPSPYTTDHQIALWDLNI